MEKSREASGLGGESEAIVQYQVAVTEATHDVVLLHLVRCMGPMLDQNVRQNFELLYLSREVLAQVSIHRASIFEAIVAREPEKAREASHRHLAFIEEVLLDLNREHSRRERSLRRLQQRRD